MKNLKESQNVTVKMWHI